MFTHKKEVNHRLGIWHLHFTHNISNKWPNVSGHYTYFLLVTILRLMGDHPRDGRRPSLAVVTRS